MNTRTILISAAAFLLAGTTVMACGDDGDEAAGQSDTVGTTGGATGGTTGGAPDFNYVPVNNKVCDAEANGDTAMETLGEALKDSRTLVATTLQLCSDQPINGCNITCTAKDNPLLGMAGMMDKHIGVVFDELKVQRPKGTLLDWSQNALASDYRLMAFMHPKAAGASVQVNLAQLGSHVCAKDDPACAQYTLEPESLNEKCTDFQTSMAGSITDGDKGMQTISASGEQAGFVFAVPMVNEIPKLSEFPSEGEFETWITQQPQLQFAASNLSLMLEVDANGDGCGTFTWHFDPAAVFGQSVFDAAGLGDITDSFDEVKAVFVVRVEGATPIMKGAEGPGPGEECKPECAPGMACEGGKCVPDDGPPPGECEPKCQDGMICDDGKCVPDDGPPPAECEPVCEAGSSCVDGKCMPDDGPPPACDPPCKDGQTCEAGKCVEKGGPQCDPPCTEGWYCDVDECVEGDGPPPEECDPPCTEGNFCDQGKCVEGEPMCNPECKVGQICNDAGECVEDAG